jgi:hypothetical protein
MRYFDPEIRAILQCHGIDPDDSAAQRQFIDAQGLTYDPADYHGDDFPRNPVYRRDATQGARGEGWAAENREAFLAALADHLEPRGPRPPRS